MADVKILLLCNNTIAVPAIKELVFFKQVEAICIPAKNKALAADLDDLLKGYDVPVIEVDRKNFSGIIRQHIEQHETTAVLLMTFPYIIPEELLSLPRRGFINFHYGKLPEYRGPEPIFTQVVKMEKEPALTIHIVTVGMDEGPVIMQDVVAYDPADTYGQLQAKLADAGARMVRVLIKILHFGSVLPSVSQDESLAAYHEKPTANTLMIDWETMDSHSIRALVNACNPWNKGCGAVINGRTVGITEIDILEAAPGKALPGTIIQLDPENGLRVSTCDGKSIRVNIFYTPEGFMSGWKMEKMGIAKGDRFQCKSMSA